MQTYYYTSLARRWHIRYKLLLEGLPPKPFYFLLSFVLEVLLKGNVGTLRKYLMLSLITLRRYFHDE